MQRGCGCISGLFFFGLFFTVGAGLAYWGWTVLQKAQASTTWPSVQGEILASDVNYWSDEDGDYYQPEVTFEYTVADRRYEASRINFSSDTSYNTNDDAQAVTNRYPVGQTIPVYYDPTEPDTAVLEPGATAGSYLLLGIGGFFILLSLIIGPIIALSSLAGGRRRRK